MSRVKSRGVPRIAVALLATLALVAASCGGDDAAHGKRSATTAPPAPAVAPLTGLSDPTGVAQTRPVLSVKLDNLPSARPQAGIEAADIVWNEVVEGGITRFLAMFQSQSPDVVGPIRSVRLTDPFIVWPVGGIFAFSGGAQYALDAIEQAPVTLVDESRAGNAMFRDRSRSAPQNLFARPDRLWTMGGEPVPPPALFTYAPPEQPSEAGPPAASVSIGYQPDYEVSYTWDDGLGSWLRSTDGRPFVTRSGSQLATRNVVILSITYKGGVGNMGAEAELVGSGDALVLGRGTETRGTWERRDIGEPMMLRTESGDAINLVPGQTWVELPDASYRVDVQPAERKQAGAAK